MKTVKQMYDNFKKDTVSKREILTEKLLKYERYKNRLLGLLTPHIPILDRVGISISDIKKIGTELPFNYLDNKFAILSKHDNITYHIVLDYVTIYILWTKKEIEAKKALALEGVYNIPYRAYHDIIKFLNIEIGRIVLEGGSYDFGNAISKIYVKEISRDFTKDKRIINNRESLDNLERIAKEKNIELYNLYKTKYISRNQFIKDMKPYVYSKENPDREKWIIYYSDDYYYFIVWLKGYSRVQNVGEFRFIPSNYIHTPSRSQIEFGNNAKSRDEIIESVSLGFRDKLNILLRFDNTMALKYKHVHDGI